MTKVSLKFDVESSAGSKLLVSGVFVCVSVAKTGKKYFFFSNTRSPLIGTVSIRPTGVYQRSRVLVELRL